MAQVDARLRAVIGLPARVSLTTTLLLLAGCLQSDPPDTAGTPAVTPAGDAPYNREERAVYREAVRQLEDYEARNQRFLAAGRATRAAKAFYQDRSRAWEESYAQLQEYERQGIRIARAPVVIRTEPASIKSYQDNAAEVVLSRCTDQSDLGMTQDGALLPPVHEEPVIQEVVVHRYENRTWLIGTFTTTDRPCGG